VCSAARSENGRAVPLKSNETLLAGTTDVAHPCPSLLTRPLRVPFELPLEAGWGLERFGPVIVLMPYGRT
jgi:hypothetical protein